MADDQSNDEDKAKIPADNTSNNTAAQDIDGADGQGINTPSEEGTPAQQQSMVAVARGADSTESGLIEKLNTEAQVFEGDLKRVFSRLGMYADETEILVKYIESRVKHLVLSLMLDVSAEKKS